MENNIVVKLENICKYVNNIDQLKQLKHLKQQLQHHGLKYQGKDDLKEKKEYDACAAPGSMPGVPGA